MHLSVTITKSSAGSGKTHKLTEEYLKILFSIQNRNLNKILAITFTNMAACEIKERIIKYLKFYALPELPESQKAFSILSIKPDSEKIRISNEILNDVFKFNSNFEISTIDSFIVSLSKFSEELGISGNYECVMNISSYIDEIIDEILFESTYNKEIQKIIYEFINVYLSIESSIKWNPVKDLKNKIEIIWNKESISGKEIKILLFKENLQKIKEEIDKLAKLKDIKINRKFKFIEKLNNCINSIDDNPEWFINLSNIINRKLEKGDLLINGSISHEYVVLWDELKKDLKNYVENFAITKTNIYVKIYHLFLKRLEEKIKNENYVPLEYIKRKLLSINFSYPEVYDHFLIDEFQDTSYVQWKILEKLLKTGKSLFVVGDKKQAIYRWRGGVMDLFEDVYKISNNLQEKNLLTNYRSGEYIVEFINKIFSEENIKRHINSKNDDNLQNLTEEILKIYSNASEKYCENNKKKGYVYVCKFEDDVKEKFLKTIENLRKYYKDKDISILVRENKEVEIFMKLLHEYDKNIQIDASFTANIKNNPYIKEIIYFLKFLESYDDFAFFKFITGEIFYKATNISKEEIFEWIMSLENKKRLYEKFKEKFNIDFEKNNNLYDVLISLFKKFKIFENFKENSLYFLHLFELIKEKEIKTLRKFFEFYESNANEDDFYINTSNSNAIHIMTIHKAKGLEFKAVVIPYAKIETRSENIFIEENDFLNLYYLKKDYLNFSEKLREIYYKEYYKRYIDELNNIYVAMTRAKECLYMFIPEKIERKNNPLVDLIFGENKEGIIERGNFEKMKDKEDIENVEKIENICIENFEYKKFLKEEESEEKEIGNLFHEILSKIEKYPDENLEKKINEIFEKYKNMIEIEKIKVIEVIEGIFNNEKFRKFFEIKDNENVFREKEIVGFDEKWNIYKIDRIIERENFVEVIDFKTGNKNEKDEEQIKNYKKLLSQIYKNKKIFAYLCYINIKENKVDVVLCE